MNETAKKLTITALTVALVCVTTSYTQIPIPGGYMHLGNVFILLTGFLFSWKVAGVAGGVGSALADWITGFPMWILPTLIIKSIMGIVIALIMHGTKESASIKKVRTWIGAVAGMLVMIGGYFIAGIWVMGGWEPSLTQIPGLSTEGVIGAVIFFVAAAAFEKAGIQKMLHRLSFR